MENPKATRARADNKDPLDYLESAVCDPAEARVMKHGADKYGRRNFRDSTILATTYVGAIRRHLNAFASGEDNDPDTGEPHLAHIRACCAVVLSAQDAHTYADDRSFRVTTGPTRVDSWVDVRTEGNYANPATGRYGAAADCPKPVGHRCDCYVKAGRPSSGTFFKLCDD